MISYSTRSFATIAIAFQLALSVTVKQECSAFTASTLASPHSSALHMGPRRTHTYGFDSAAVFSQIDKDGNGKIDAQELRDYLVERGPYTEAVAKSIFERLDANHDGDLSLEELDQGMKKHNLFRAVVTPEPKTAHPATKFAVKPKPNNKKLKKAQQIQHYKEQAQRFFEKMDVNKDGYISLAELKEHFLVKRMQVIAQSSGLFQKEKSSQPKSSQFVAWHHSEAAIQKLFNVLDVNDDGMISLQEWREAFVKYPSVRHAFQA